MSNCCINLVQETKQKRAELCKAYFEQQVAKTIADNQAAAEAAAAAEKAKEEAAAEAQRKAEEEEAWRQRMMRLRGETESRMDALHRMQEDRDIKHEGSMKQHLRHAGIRLPQMATLLPCVLLYDTETTSFEERFFVRQIVKLLESGGIKVNSPSNDRISLKFPITIAHQYRDFQQSLAGILPSLSRVSDTRSALMPFFLGCRYGGTMGRVYADRRTSFFTACTLPTRHGSWYLLEAQGKGIGLCEGKAGCIGLLCLSEHPGGQQHALQAPLPC